MTRHGAKFFLAIVLLAGVWELTTLGPWDGRGWLGRADDARGPVRILRFYASVGSVTPGQSAMLCYGVENARVVRISPPVAEVYPASQRCLEIVPKHTTHYTIWAEGFDGRVAMKSLTLPVEAIPPAPPRELNFAMWLQGRR